jgi:hypothetical protein
VSDLEQLIKLVTAQHRWAIHPIKVAIALLIPVLIVWAADWWMRRLSNALAPRGGVHGDAVPARPIGGG